MLCCDHWQLIWSQNVILFVLSLIKQHKYTSLRNEISVFMIFKIFHIFKGAIYWYHLITWEKEILWLLYEFERMDYVQHWKKKHFEKQNGFDLKNGGDIFLFNCGKIFVVCGISYCYITRGIWYHPPARDMIYIAMV